MTSEPTDAPMALIVPRSTSMPHHLLEGDTIVFSDVHLEFLVTASGTAYQTARCKCVPYGTNAKKIAEYRKQHGLPPIAPK